MRQDVLRIFEGPEFGAAGTDPAYPRTLAEIGVNPRVRYNLDGRDTLTFTVPDTADMRALITARKVVRLTPDGEPTSEWLVSRTTQAAGPSGGGVMQVECDPLWVVLSDAGILEFVETGGQSYANLGGINGTINNYLATFVLPHLTRRGYTWIDIGTIDSSVQFSYSWDSFTATQLIEALAKEVGAEWRLRRDEPNSEYKIDIVERIGGTIADIEAREGLNILQLVRQRNRERLFTSVRPTGGLAPGAEERANIGYNAWRVTDVTGDDVQVEPHQGGLGAILEDGQHVGLYLEAADGTFHEIEGSVESTQTFELESGAGASFAVDDDVSIIADDQGTLLTSIESPSGVFAFGFVQGGVNSQHLGHRNWVRNPALSNWPDKPDVLAVQLDGSQTSTTINWKGFPASYVVAVGDYVVSGGGVTVAVTTGGTADGSGNLTLTFASSISGSDNTWFWFYQATKSFPVLWQGPFGGAAWLRAAAVNESANVDGTGTTGRLMLKNLPANFVVPGGSVLSPSTQWVMADATADGAGNVELIVRPALSRTDDDAITISRPTIPGSGFVMGTPIFVGGQSIRQNIYIRPNSEPITFEASFWGWSSATGATVDWGDTSPRGPRVLIQTADGSSTLATGNRVDVEFTATNTLFSAVATVNHVATADEYRFVVEMPSTNESITSAWALRSAMLYLGTEPPPFVEGSEATRIFQDGQLALLASRQWPATYTARLSEIVSEWGLDPNSPALNLGSFLRVRSPSVGIDAILRVVAIEFDPTNPQDKTFTLDADPERISALTARARPRPVFVNVNVEIKDNRARETILVSESPPVAAPGAERFVVPEGTVAPPGVLPVEPLPDDFLL